MLSANEIRGLYAILPTPAKPGAEHVLARDTVDLDETARAVEALITDGCDGLIALGTTGECATVSQEDYDAFVGCLVETTRKRVPLFVGTSAMASYEVARRMRLVNDLGVEGTLLGLPMWQPVTVDAAVQYYRELSEGFPEVAIMVYAYMRAFRFAFPDEFWQAVIKVAPTVVSAKYAQPRDLRKLIAITEGRVNIVPNERTMARFYDESPATTVCCWSTAASMGPQPTIALMRAVERGDTDSVKRISAVLDWANEPILPIISNPEVFAQFNIQIEKIRISAAGYCNAGPVRSPYAVMPEDFAEFSRESGRRWALLNREMAAGRRLEDFVAETA